MGIFWGGGVFSSSLSFGKRGPGNYLCQNSIERTTAWINFPPAAPLPLIFLKPTWSTHPIPISLNPFLYPQPLPPSHPPLFPTSRSPPLTPPFLPYPIPITTTFVFKKNSPVAFSSRCHFFSLSFPPGLLSPKSSSLSLHTPSRPVQSSPVPTSHIPPFRKYTPGCGVGGTRMEGKRAGEKGGFVRLCWGVGLGNGWWIPDGYSVT